MKIIDVLNLIAKGEEVPKKIKYKNVIYVYVDYFKWYQEENEANEWLYYGDMRFINDKVEIIEEEKEIEKLYFSVYECERLEQTALDKIETKINELIDVINDMRDKE